MVNKKMYIKGRGGKKIQKASSHRRASSMETREGRGRIKTFLARFSGANESTTGQKKQNPRTHFSCDGGRGETHDN